MVEKPVDRDHALNELSLEVVFPDNGEDYPSVSMLIDGTDRLRYASAAGWMGFEPSEIFASREILIPGVAPRRVAVYRCSCGEPGCGSLAPLIESDGESLIKWSDFRDFTGVFYGPVALDDPDDEDPFSGGVTVAVEDIVFDRQQYEAEIDRAMADLSWESEGRKTARLLEQLLREGQVQRLEAFGVTMIGVTFDWGSKEDSSWTLELRPIRPPEISRPSRQILMTLRTEEAVPEEQARSLLEQLHEISVEKWEISFPFRLR